MIYRFLLLSDEKENFERIIEISSDTNFLEFQKAILESVKYTDSEMTAFYICSEDWERQQEILPMDMGNDSSVDTYLMSDTKLDEFIEDEGQRLLFVFDMLTDRAFFIELKEVIVGRNLQKPVCIAEKGNPPKQIIEFDKILEDTIKKDNNSNIFDDDLYDTDLYNEDEFDHDGFSDLNFD